jgi:DNA repair exonuclease SbcCD ATPase subunit
MLISDIHLRDYHRYNKYPHERLDSFVKLAEDIVKIGKKNSITTLLIGGDIVDKNTLSPLELHALFKMFTILADQFRIYSIIGNHDAKSKSSIAVSDTVITLLTEIEGISFHHQEILSIGGRTIAFENWMPEYDLSWIEEPTDLYISHATIDYDNTGFYGMDTSVFKDKFTLGVFGDIHVTRQIDNLVSIGNTKQESLSDKAQGGVMIMDLTDLSYERVPIDPENKKYLKLEKTQDQDLAGWKDKDGDSMVYYVYQPKKIAGKTVDFKVPLTTDIESTTSAIMKKTNLLELHKDIKSESSYSPVDFNFQLKYLKVKNFRSIANYVLDFNKDYMIHGSNGTGKSSLLTALFYSLVGKKTLKSQIRIGEKSCNLEVSLTYQGIDYVIIRGTDAKDFGLIVGGRRLKFNSKLEFERAVYEYLPFLNYHESFLFNSWDTELLGSLKIDKRYDLLSKYYRLDSLSRYNDISSLRLKAKKKELKTILDNIAILKAVKESREKDLEDLLSDLEGKMSKEEVVIKLKEAEESNLIEKDLKEVNAKWDETISTIEDHTLLIEAQRTLLGSLESTLNISKSQEELNRDIGDRISYEETSSRIAKGTEFIKSLSKNIEDSKKDIEVIEAKVNSLGVSTLKEIPEELLSNLESVKSKLTDYRTSYFQEYANLNSSIERWESSLKELEATIEKLEEAPESDETCKECGQIISQANLLEQLLEEKKAISKTLSTLYKSKDTLDKKYSGDKEDNLIAEERLLEDSYNKLVSENKTFEKNLEERTSLLQKIESLESSIEADEATLVTSNKTLEELNSKLDSLNRVKSFILAELKSELRNTLLISQTKETLSNLEKEYNPKISELRELSETFKPKRESLKFKLSKYTQLTQEETSELRDLKYSYSKVDDLIEKHSLSKKEYELENTGTLSITTEISQLEEYYSLTSRSGSILRSILDELTKTFSTDKFKFSTTKKQSSGKVVTDMSVDFLVGSNWIPYTNLSSGQKTLCDLYYLNKVITGVGVVFFDETLKHLDDENLNEAAELIDTIKKNNVLISSHSNNLSIDGTETLSCSIQGNTTQIVVEV